MNRRSYTDEQLKEAVKNSPSIRKVLSYLNLAECGGNYSTIPKRIKELKLDTSHFHNNRTANLGRKFGPRRPIEDYLTGKCKIKSHSLRLRLIKDNILPHQCNKCKLKEWLNIPIPLELHHKDGNKYNNNLSNIELLCPNCHALTDNHAGKAKKKQPKLIIPPHLCIDCNQKCYHRSKRCRQCADNIKRNGRGQTRTVN